MFLVAKTALLARLLCGLASSSGAAGSSIFHATGLPVTGCSELGLLTYAVCMQHVCAVVHKAMCQCCSSSAH
jgi:hypothetical protein